jgi:hypothetical protein
VKTYSVSGSGEIHISAEVQIHVPVNTLDIVTAAYYFSQAVEQSGKMLLIRYNSKFNYNRIIILKMSKHVINVQSKAFKQAYQKINHFFLKILSDIFVAKLTNKKKFSWPYSKKLAHTSRKV